MLRELEHTPDTPETAVARCLLLALHEDRAVTHAELREVSGDQPRMTDEVIADVTKHLGGPAVVKKATVGNRDVYLFQPAIEHALWKALDDVRQIDRSVRAGPPTGAQAGAGT